MARIDVDAKTVLEAVRSHLIANVPGANTSNTYWALDQAIPKHLRGGDFFLNLHPGDGVYDEDGQIGASDLQLQEDFMLQLTIWNRRKTDPTDAGADVMLNDDGGLFVVLQAVLKAMVGADLTTPGGDTFLRQLIVARGRSAIGRDPANSLNWLTLTFGVAFDWDLA